MADCVSCWQCGEGWIHVLPAMRPGCWGGTCPSLFFPVTRIRDIRFISRQFNPQNRGFPATAALCARHSAQSASLAGIKSQRTRSCIHRPTSAPGRTGREQALMHSLRPAGNPQPCRQWAKNRRVCVGSSREHASCTAPAPGMAPRHSPATPTEPWVTQRIPYHSSPKAFYCRRPSMHLAADIT